MNGKIQSCNLYLIFSFLFCIKNKWRLHITYPKREVPFKAPKNLFFERPNFPVSHSGDSTGDVEGKLRIRLK